MNLRAHGTVEPYGNEYKITFELAGFKTRESAQVVNGELGLLIRAYFEQMHGGKPVRDGTGTPPWKQQ